LKLRPSDLLRDKRAWREREFLQWSEALVQIWKNDSSLQDELEFYIEFFDQAQEIAERLIRSAFE
jgi:hypothetical protein